MRAHDPEGRLFQRRPAETATPVALAVAFLIATLLDVTDDTTIWALAVVVAFVPAAVTWTVNLRRSA